MCGDGGHRPPGPPSTSPAPRSGTWEPPVQIPSRRPVPSLVASATTRLSPTPGPPARLFRWGRVDRGHLQPSNIESREDRHRERHPGQGHDRRDEEEEEEDLEVAALTKSSLHQSPRRGKVGGAGANLIAQTVSPGPCQDRFATIQPLCQRGGVKVLVLGLPHEDAASTSRKMSIVGR